MSENKENKRNKDLNEKEIEKVSGGCCDPRGCIPNPWDRWKKENKNLIPNWEKIPKDLKPFLKNSKDKSLKEKEIEKVSGGISDEKKIDFKSMLSSDRMISSGQRIMTYSAPGMFPKPGKIVSLKEIQQKKKTSSPNKVKNLQPFPDENKN